MGDGPNVFGRIKAVAPVVSRQGCSGEKILRSEGFLMPSANRTERHLFCTFAIPGGSILRGVLSIIFVSSSAADFARSPKRDRTHSG